jgi:hypothetical protein
VDGSLPANFRSADKSGERTPFFVYHLEYPVALSFTVMHFLAAQIDGADLTCVAAYRQSEQRWRHTAGIRDSYGYCEFMDRGVQFRLGRWLCALCWTGTDRPCRFSRISRKTFGEMKSNLHSALLRRDFPAFFYEPRSCGGRLLGCGEILLGRDAEEAQHGELGVVEFVVDALVYTPGVVDEPVSA